MSGKILRPSFVLALPAVLLSCQAFGACVSLSALDSAYSQNFDSLGNAGKSSILPTGWALAESGSSGNNDGQYNADDGTNTGGDTYSYGATGSTERAFGTLQSGTLTPTIGACFTNDTGGTITSLDIAYTGEEWRLGTASRADALNFEYSTDATSLTTGTWTAVAALNFTTPDTATTGKKNGNAAGERTALSSTIAGLSIASGTTVWIHWIDFNASGADDGLAVDDFSLNPHGTPGGGSTNPGGTGSATPASVPNDGATATLLTVVPTPGSNPTSMSYTVTADLSSIGGSATQTFYDDGSNGDVTPGDGTFSFSTTVANATSPGAKSLPTTIVDDKARTGMTSIALTVTAAAINLTIMQIQGHGAASAYAGQTVSTSGNVVTAVGPKGFFMQDPNGDGDSTTSDGIYVYTASAPTVAVGNIVTVSGKVQEFSGSTELTAPTVTLQFASGATVAPFELAPTDDPTTGPCVGGASTLGNPPTASEGYQASNFACLDGMLVTMSDAIVTGATFGGKINASDPVGSDAVHVGLPNGFYATPAGSPRPSRGPGALYPGLGGSIPVWNGAPQVIEIYYKGLSFAPGNDDPASNDPNYADAADFVYHAGTRFAVTGVIQGYQPSGAASPTYELYPRDMSTTTRVTPAAAVQPVPDPVAGTLTFGTQNLLHMFNDVLDGTADTGNCPSAPALGGSDWCPTTVEYNARRSKWAQHICNVLKSPVVLDIEEVESLSVARDLATSVQAQCGTQYNAYVLPGNDVGGINIGILVRNGVAVDSVTQMYKGTTTSNCSSGTSCLLNDRPPVLMRASWNGYPFALLAIYDRSLSGIDTKPYVGKKRAEQAAQVASIAQAFQSGATLTGAGNAQQAADGTITTGAFDIVGDANIPLVIAGDFNAYEFSDGYADVTGMIMGTADPSKNLYWASGYVAPSPTLVDSGIAADPANRYSFNFDGLTQEIDHILLSRRAWRDFVRVDNAHGNSDVAEASGVILDDLTAARSGDHDGQVITVAIDRIFADGFGPQP
jgi:predicted extracellular nuclease